MRREWVILGIGNLLMSDDGVGIHAVRELARRPIAGVEAVDAGTDVLSALPWLESARRVLLLDAIQGRGAPGTIYQLTEPELAPRPGAGLAHATSLLEARRLLPPDVPWPEMVVAGVEPAVLAYGLELSPPVAAALPGLVALAREIVANGRQQQFNNPDERVAS